MNNLEEWQQRVVDEKKELDDKLEKLVQFKYNRMFSALPIHEQERLNTQGHIMCSYSAILGERIRHMVTNDRAK